MNYLGVNMIMKFYNWLKSLWISPIKEAQKQYNKSNCLNKYEPHTWKEELFWW